LRRRHARCPISSQFQAVVLRTVDLVELEPRLSTSDNKDIPIPGHLALAPMRAGPEGAGRSGPDREVGEN